MQRRTAWGRGSTQTLRYSDLFHNMPVRLQNLQHKTKTQLLVLLQAAPQSCVLVRGSLGQGQAEYGTVNLCFSNKNIHSGKWEKLVMMRHDRNPEGHGQGTKTVPVRLKFWIPKHSNRKLGVPFRAPLVSPAPKRAFCGCTWLCGYLKSAGCEPPSLILITLSLI